MYSFYCTLIANMALQWAAQLSQHLKEVLLEYHTNTKKSAYLCCMAFHRISMLCTNPAVCFMHIYYIQS